MDYKKSLGQHFLIDKNIASKIVRLTDISKNDTVLEIGSGSGILTEKLLQKCKELFAFEIDKNWADFLKKRFSDSHLFVINEDILKTDFSKIFKNKKIKIVANLPYHITSPIIFKIIENRELFSSITIMIQDEVAERIVAKPNCKNYGRLTVKVQRYFDVKKLFTVPPHLFKPRPKVTSSVIRFIPKKKIPSISDENLFNQIVDYTFQHRRKMLRSNLRNFLSEKIYQKIIKNKFDFSKRPENLGIKEFIFLTELISEATKPIKIEKEQR